jgi:hypothetical protein
MVRARDEEIHGRREAESARGAAFDCEFCVRPDDERYRGPKVDEDGEDLAPWEVLEFYNQRRYEHLQTFLTTKELRVHLEDRAHWWTQGKGREALDTALQTVDSTVEMLERRRDAKVADEREGRRVAREAAKALKPATDFAEPADELAEVERVRAWAEADA